MFEIGDYVVKINKGVCRIADIVHLDMSGVDKQKEYYLLIPVEDQGAKVYVPVEGREESMRCMMDEAAAWDFIRKIPAIQTKWIANEKLREQEYKAAIRSGKPEELVGIIKNMYHRRKKRVEQGKKNTAVDERYFRMAEDALYSELAFATGRKKDEICQLIKDAAVQLQQDKPSAPAQKQP